MAILSLEQQRQLGRQLDQLRRGNSPDEAADASEKTGEMPAVGTAGFILLGGFALLKDIFDFIFVGMAFFKSRVVAAADNAQLAADATSLALLLFPEAAATKIAAFVAKIVSWGAMGVSTVGGIFETKTQAEGVILPFLFTNMFMIVVIAFLLFSGLGLKSHAIFLSARLIFVSLIAEIVEIVPVLNIFPWITIFVIFLYFHVKKELKKQQEENQTT